MSGYEWRGPVPEGPLCQCGCKQPVGFAKRTRNDKGVVRGQPNKYLLGHNPASGPKARRVVAGQERQPLAAEPRGRQS